MTMDKDRQLVDQMQSAIEDLTRAAHGDAWMNAFERFKACRDEAYDALRRPVRRRRKRKRKETRT